jgi:hypothetical protein
MPTRQTSKPSARKERTGVDRLYKRVGVRKVSFYYQYPNGTNETLATAVLGNRQAIMEAERVAKRKALDIQNGQIISGSTADGIDRFQTECDATHYQDQSKDGIAVRKGAYENLKKFFGNMHPQAIKTIHGYQYADARSKAGAPKKAWKELSQMSTICHKWVEWGIIETNPLLGMRKPRQDKDVRTITRRHVIRFYLWSQRQDKPQFKIMGCAALFAYLTGYRAAEVRPFHRAGLTNEGVRVTNAKRKMGEAEIIKLREWSKKLRVAVKRADQALGRERMYIFGNRHGSAYTRSGWGSVWQDAMLAYIGCSPSELVAHPMYFALSDERPAAITKKLDKREADAYDFAAHANKATTHAHYDRRRVKKASATE